MKLELCFALVLGVIAGVFVPSVARGQSPAGTSPQVATENLHRRAEAGDAASQLCLGLLYAAGDGVPKSQAEAAKWFRMAAEQGNAIAQCELANALWEGAGVTRDDGEAVKWYRIAAEQGDARAQLLFAVAHMLGRGVPQDDAEAAKWLQRAATQGNNYAQCELGLAYARGKGVVKDERQAIMWFRRSAEQGYALAQFHLGVMFRKDDGVPRDDAQALKWFQLAAEQGEERAQLNLAVIYSRGDGVPKDDAEAARYFRLAAEQGSARGQWGLSRMYWYGEGVPKNHVLAYSWASLAAASGIGGAREFREFLETKISPQEVAEAQRIAAEFKPKVWKADEAQKLPVAAPRVDVTGSGFFITPDGCFVTNHHVVADATSIRVRTATGTFPATVIRSDPSNDIAILKVAGEFSALAVRGSRGVKLADRVATVGFPNPELQGEAAKYASGEVAALSGPTDDPRFLQISAPIQPGNSGGPLVDATGAVVGVVVSQLDKIATLKLTGNIPENVNYAIKGTILLGVLESVPGLAEKVRTEPQKPATDAAEVATTLEAACGLVLVEK